MHRNSKNEIRQKKTYKESKMRGLSIEINKAGMREKRSHVGLSQPNQNIISIIVMICNHDIYPVKRNHICYYIMHFISLQFFSFFIETGLQIQLAQ